MITNCAPLLADLFLYSYEADFIQGLLKKNGNKLGQTFNFRYIDDVFSLNNSRFGDFVDHIYPIELEIDTTDTDQRSTKQTQKTKNRVTRTPLKTGRVSSSCSTSGTLHVNLVINPVISHE
jgi:hypothetical protein